MVFEGKNFSRLLVTQHEINIATEILVGRGKIGLTPFAVSALPFLVNNPNLL